MALLLEVNINLDSIDKSKIFKGKKGKYYKMTLSVNDDTNDWGQNVAAFDSQTKEQRDAKEAKNYLGNGKVFWTDGNVKTADKKEAERQQAPAPAPEETDDLPF